MSDRGPRIKASPARLAALEVCTTVRVRKAFTQEIIATVIDQSSLSAEDRGFATRLALGVTSSQGTLDEVINRFLRSPKELQNDVRDALRISTYEILFLDKTAHAAVDQGVELAKSVNPKVSGLANAVLRKVVTAKADFPFGDPKVDTQALARSFAFPAWLTQKLIDDLGREAAVSFMEASNEPAPVFIAINAAKSSAREVLSIFESQDIGARQFSIPGLDLDTCYRLMDSKAIRNPELTALFSEGKVLVSDVASQTIAYLALPAEKPGSFLEVGAGRGTKSILLQSGACRCYGSQMALSVLDNHEFKMRILKKRMDVFNVKINESLVGDARDLSQTLGDKLFDAAFIDAPCSGLGTLRRHPEIRWRLKPEDILALADLGLAMLKEVSRHISPGGLLTYSTCTTTREENRGVIEAFLRSEEGKGFELETILGKKVFMTTLSPGSSDAHFAVRMVRTV